MATSDDQSGPIVSETWVTSQKAVNAFRAFSLDQGWVFTETPEQTDFGKDGYLDFTRNGRLTGQCIALQIKGGVSFHRRDSFVIPADRRRRTFWMESSRAAVLRNLEGRGCLIVMAASEVGGIVCCCG